MVDDIVDSGGTLCNAAKALMDAGALSVDAYVTHGVLSGGAVSRIASSPLTSLVTTDSIQATEAFRVARNIKQYQSPLCLVKPSSALMKKNLFLAYFFN